MEQSEKRKEMGRPLILCLNTICVLDRGLKVKGLGVFYLSISHQIIRKIIKETVGKADLWGVVWHSGSKGPGQETTLSGTPLCWYPLRALVCNSRTEPTLGPVVPILAHGMKYGGTCLTQNPVMVSSP